MCVCEVVMCVCEVVMCVCEVVICVCVKWCYSVCMRSDTVFVSHYFISLICNHCVSVADFVCVLQREL